MNTGRPLGLSGSVGDDASSVANRTPLGVRALIAYRNFHQITKCLMQKTPLL